MRKRYRKPKLKNDGGYWIAQYRDRDGTKRRKSLGPVDKVRKYEAEKKLAMILEPINSASEPSPDMPFGDFVNNIYLPFYKRGWKESTARANEERVEYHLIGEFEKRELGRLRREELQQFLERKAAAGLSYSVVAHLRWDLRQILRMAVTEGHIRRNPAELLIIPPEAPRPVYSSMTFDQVRLFLSVLELREKVISGLAILAGMRPGEIFALTRSRVVRADADFDQRIYRGRIGTPKSPKSRRWAAMGDGLSAWIAQWLEMLPDTRPEGWLFPSERNVTPLAKDNCWRRNFLPQLKPVGLDWANFQVMRRTHSSLAADLDVDPQVRADQMGHAVDVNQNTYTRASLDRRRHAVNALEKAVGIQ
jgi:integrase